MSAGAADYNEKAKTNNWAVLCDASVTFNHPDLRRLLGVWRKQANRRSLPVRRDLTPRLLKSFHKDIALYERVAAMGGARRWRVLQMGASFAQIVGDMTGKFLDEAIQAEFLPRWHAALDATLGQGAPLRFLTRADTWQMPFLIGEYFAAPLIADDGSASLILGAGRFTGGRSWPAVEAEARKALGLE
jgi:hypothetical protein